MDISSEMVHSLLPLVMVAMNVVYALSAYPFGKLSDSMSHDTRLAWGLVVLIAADWQRDRSSSPGEPCAWCNIQARLREPPHPDRCALRLSWPFPNGTCGSRFRWRTRLLVALVVLSTAASAVLGLRTYRTFTLLSSAYEAGVPQTSSVRPWMTLRYVAAAYGAPEAALRDSLGLPPQTPSDTTLEALARQAAVSRADYIQRVQRAIAAVASVRLDPPVGESTGCFSAASDSVVSAVLTYGYPALALSLLLGAFGVPLPSGLSMVLAGSLAAHGQMRWEVLAMIAAAASVAGDLAGYAVGRMLGQGFLERRGHWFGLTADRRAGVARLFDRWGILAVLLSRSLVSVLSSAVNLVAGAGRYRLGAFVLVGIIGRLLWSSAYLGLGYFASGDLEPAADFLRSLTGLLVSLALLTWAGFALRAAGNRSYAEAA